MKSVRRRLKKRTRARTFNELEGAFYDLVQRHNLLTRKHAILMGKVNSTQRGLGDIAFEHRSYGLDKY